MPYTLTTTDSRIGGIANPLSDDYDHLALNADKELTVEDRELAEAIVDTYDEMVFVVTPPEDSESDSEEDEEAETETYTCAGNDGECSREVEEEGGYCWQHEGE